MFLTNDTGDHIHGSGGKKAAASQRTPRDYAPLADEYSSTRAMENQEVGAGRSKKGAKDGDQGLVLGGEGDGGEHGIVDGADGREIFFHGSEGQDADHGAVAGVDAVVVDGLAVLGAVANFECYGFGGAGDGWGERGVDFGLTQVFAEHFGLGFDVLGESDAGTEAFFHRADVAREGIFYILLNAKTLLDLPAVGDFMEGPTANGKEGGLAGARRWKRA